MPIAPGTRLGPYEIGARIGAGGMGEVYRARHTRLDREVAVKVLPEDLARDAEALARFEREARAIAALSHPNILAIHDFGTEAGTSFAVMELLRGDTLRGRIHEAPLPWKKAVEVAIAVADGLAAAHAKGVVHRDIKPENLFITTDGHVKILDFGLARLVEAPSPSSSHSTLSIAGHTRPGTVLGTPAYMSPEQARGETAGPGTDIFSLGCVLHEMLTGKRAFARGSAAESAAAILKEDPPPPSASDPSIPPALDALVRHCLEKAAVERFQSARDTAFALRAIVTTPDRAPTPAAPRARTAAPWPRRRGVAAGVAALAVVLAAAAAWLSRSTPQTPRAGGHRPESIAVLPFRDLAPAEGDPYFADSVADAVIADLSRVPGLTVINRSSAFEFRGRGADAAAVGAALNVRYLVDGTVQRTGERLRVRAKLVDAATGDERWAKGYDGTLRDLFAIQEDISRSAARAIGPPANQADSVAPRRPPPDFEVYDLYLRGRAAWSRRTLAETERAIDLYQEAIRRDPGFARAYAGLADALVTQSGQLYTVARSQALPRAKAAAERALLLDATLAEAHASLGNLFTKDLRWDEAEREFRLAIDLDPNYATARHWYALLLLAQRGRLDEARREIARAAELDPLAPALLGSFAHILSFQGEYAPARLRAERAHELAPSYFGPLRLLSRIHALEGRRQDALVTARRAAALAPGSPIPRAQVARALAESGDVRAARALLADLEGQGEPCVECIVDVQLALGDLDAALARVERGGFVPSAHYFPKVDPSYGAFRADPRFRRVLEAARLE